MLPEEIKQLLENTPPKDTKIATLTELDAALCNSVVGTS